MTAEECAALTVRAMERRQRMAILSLRGRLGPAWSACSRRASSTASPGRPSREGEVIRQQVEHVAVATRRGLVEVTGHVRERRRVLRDPDGMCTVFIRHTSASLVIQENADPAARRDLEAFLDRLVPDGDPLYTHVAEGDDDMPSHVKAALTRTSEQVPVVEGRWPSAPGRGSTSGSTARAPTGGSCSSTSPASSSGASA